MKLRIVWLACAAGTVAAVSLLGCDAELSDTDEGGAGTDDPAANVEASVGVSLDRTLQDRLGVSLAPIEPASFEERIEGPGLVVDAQPVVEVTAALAAAQAAARQSDMARERAAALFGSDAAGSRETLESAERQSAADAATLDVARARALVAYGNAAPWLDATRRTHIMAAITQGDAVVVRASFPGGLPGGDVPGELSFRQVGVPSASGEWRTRDVWAGPADPAVPGPSLLAYVEPGRGLVSGARIVASFRTGTRVDGVQIPASAVVIVGGSAWCYVADDETLFVRRPVDLEHPQAEGYFQARGFEGGESVVVQGAGLLLARELSSVEEED